MAETSNGPGELDAGSGSAGSPESGSSKYVVNFPLSPERIAWLRQQSKNVAKVFRERYGERD